MTQATTTEVARSWPSVLKRVQEAPVIIRDEERDVAVLVSLEDFETLRLERIKRFEQVRDKFADELNANLAKDGITVEQFLADILSHD